ncbi:FG-GAP-like repeat-containing protein [Flavobacterium lindanitolerans]|uniref:FG-GAP-like repeat-containing protein n=1 Tax=Flavobacterium lindanitolerans TaxID=428988 RepID=UPI0023F4FF47|nr:FG-GAP-like repeat-containing protein [Flavobacterium lindanitolerans]
MASAGQRTADVGKTTLNLDISQGGAAVATLPIILPPGVNGFTPEISLQYNSQSGNGIAGYGWNLGGTSSITRIPATKFHSGKIGDIRINESDFFALDGQRLLLKSGTYGQPNAEYQTENYSNIRVFSRLSVPTAGGMGPEYFEVWYPDGSRAVYGSSPTSKTAVEYGVSYRESNLGATIQYNYSNSNNILKLVKISYGALGTNVNMNVVDFSYQNSIRPEQSYVWGQNLSKDFILSKISVSVSGTAIRHYELSNTGNPFIGYQRLSAIQETNGDASRVLDMIYLHYGNTYGDLVFPSISNLSLTGITSNNSDAIFADFTGNGTLDFVVRPKTKDKFWTFLDLENNSPNMQFAQEVIAPHKELFPVRMLTQNSKLLSEDGFAMVIDQYGSYKFDVLSRGISSSIYPQYDRTWQTPTTYGYYSECDNQFHEGSPLDQEFISGDFNGDGLTDIIAIGKPQFNIIIGQRWVEPTWNPPTNPWDPQPPITEPIETGCVTDYGNYYNSQIHLINLDRRITTNFVSPLGSLNKPFTDGEKLFTGDFNGDGKTDILYVSNGAMFVLGLNDNNTFIQTLFSIGDPQISLSQAFYLGDFNGDGKTDVLVSTTAAHTFALFMSKGNGFKKHTQQLPSPFGRGQVNEYYQNNQLHQTMSTMLVTDINGDGKADIVQIGAAATYSVPTGTIRVLKLDNMGYTEANGINFLYDSSLDQERTANIIPNPIPVLLSLDKINHRLEVGWLSGNTLSTFQFTADVQNARQLTSIWNKNESYDITYAKLMSNAPHSPDATLYIPGTSQTYPNVDFVNAPGLSVVSKITNDYNNTNHLQQVFSYGQAVSNMEGLGFLGFGRMARSNWHVDHSDPIRMFDINITDPQLRGASTNAFRARQPYISSGVLSLPAISDGATIGDYVSRSDMGYHTELLPNKVFIAMNNTSSGKDLLSGVTNSTITEYDSYFNVTKTTTNINNEGTRQEETTYENNDNGYYIGRPLTQKTTMTVGADSHVSESEIHYNGFLVSQIKRRENGSPWVSKNMVHDFYGNVISHNITNSTGTRTTSSTFDPTGRFALSETNEEGLSTTSTYDPINGIVLTSTNSFGQATSYEHDTWGRLVGTVDHLGKGAYKNYTQGTAGFSVRNFDDEGKSHTSFYNELGQETFKETETILGGVVGQAFEYDIYRRPYRESKPAAPGSYNQWNTTEYDEYGRVKKMTSFTGKIISFSYNALKTTENDGTKSVTTERNGLGQVISREDPGGKIIYTYYAHGGLKSAALGGSVQSLEYDAWGRRTKLIDPSAGQYQYVYNGFGEITQESSPKGVVNYSYDNSTGKLMGKTFTGDGTSLTYAYNYNNTTKLLESLTFNNTDGNNTTYSYTYDSHYRIASTIEDNQYAKFTRGFSYDSFGRMDTESYEAKDKTTNLTASRSVGYEYQKGEVLKSMDLTSGQIISQITSLTTDGNLASATQGSSLRTNFVYDSFNLPQSATTSRIGSNPAAVMTLSYVFDAERGNLMSRSNSATGWNEGFEYDNLNRLTSDYNDYNVNGQDYDARGRITYNSQLGNYTYSGDSYQQIELTNLNPAAQGWYQSRSLQQITYNAFKKPISIHEQGHERIDFQYNSALQRSHMFFGSDDSDKLLRPMRRHYSEDGSMEITRDINTNRTSFVFYLGGDAYTAPAIYKELHKPAGTLGALYYLHRDHLGSIVLISDVDGNTVEKRQFDAWGNLVKLEDGLGNALTSFQIIDRGYTAHEHLLTVGLINMNGRLYDPKLHRFLSPDNFIQDITNSQNFNRYGYVMNNPLIASDPNGEFIHLILGAFIGGVVNWFANGAQFSWKGLGHLLVGAGAGLVGSGVGSGVSSALGGGSFGAGFIGAEAAKVAGSSFISGSLIGAAAGGAGGFVSNVGNAALDGKSLGGSLLSGFKGGGIGALTGGIIGGIYGGIDAARDGRKFWSGNGEGRPHAFGAIENGSTDWYKTNEEMRADYDNLIASRDGVSLLEMEVRLNAEVSLIGGYEVTDRGSLINPGGSNAAGLTRSQYLNQKFVGARIAIAPNVKALNLYEKNLVFKHEFLHAAHLMTPEMRRLYDRYSEKAAHQYSYAYAKLYKLNSSIITNHSWLAQFPVPKSFSWKTLGNLIPLWIK